MKFSKALPWLPSLLVLAGCPSEPEPKPPQLDKVSVTCTPTTLEAGQGAQCSASATDQNGQPFTVSSYTWSSGDETLAKVDASGKVATVVVSSGTVAIRASASAGDTTRQGEASLSVTPKPPTVHSTPVTAAETWRAANNPHLVSAALVVDGGATLTLEAGTVVRFAPGAELRVAHGSLRAPGTPEAPILLQAQNGATRGSWNGVVLASKDSASTLEHVTLSGCGPQSAGACLVIRDGAAPVLKDVSVRDSASTGVLVASDGSSFGAGSIRLSVSGSEGPAVRIDANQAGTLPTGGAFTSNKPDAVELTGARVSRTQTWPNPGIAFIVNEELTVGDKTTPAILTLAAGTVVRFGANLGLFVGSTGDIHGGLVLDGTAEAPILLTAHADAPQPGHWRGVHVMTSAAYAGRISHATIEYAGAEPKPDDFTTPGQGNLNLYGNLIQATAFIATDLVVRRSSEPGLVLVDGGGFAAGSARLTSRENGTYPILMQPGNVRTLPPELTFQNNGINALALHDGELYDTQTWPNMGMPYLLRGTMIVGFTTPPTLTLAPGTEIQLAQGAAILIGARGRPGALKAVGTTDAPIRFVPDIPNAPNGHWAGLHFWDATGSRLDHVLVSHGGGESPPYQEDAVYGLGNVNVHRELGKFMTNSTMSKAKECAATRDSGLNDYLEDPSLNNNFADNPIDALCWNTAPR
ncbi:hypothetical protein CYFUS_004742 [Cystobacter fuscus]|uniref:BIG2 domain-containing protein n=1 Tax=Cystobacter fuscus TaxID=43 RepID=A0A250J6Y6_9BACT|nr:hypothetical protein [Cystobacter fuscus]ATB39298.1 hypothetical protein CYFUS_004742 [Cystobacter fuscus]